MGPVGIVTAILGLVAAAVFGPLAFGVSLIIWLLGLLAFLIGALVAV